jgi:hypothetical protein
MRTKTLLVAAAALVAGIISSKAQTVYSANVVGYATVVIPPGPQFAFIANPLDSGNNVLTNTLQSLPLNSKVYKWDYANSTFDKIFTRSSLGAGGWSSGSGTNTDNPGEGFVVQLPASYTTPFTNIFVGNVIQGNFTNPIVPGYNALAFDVPVNSNVTNWNLNAVLPASPTGSKIYRWDLANQNFDLIYTRSSLGAGGWSSGVIPPINLGEGYFIFNNSANTYNWTNFFQVQ